MTFGRVKVSGRMRKPSPAARTTAFILGDLVMRSFNELFIGHLQPYRFAFSLGCFFRIRNGFMLNGRICLIVTVMI